MSWTSKETGDFEIIFKNPDTLTVWYMHKPNDRGMRAYHAWFTCGCQCYTSAFGHLDLLSAFHRMRSKPGMQFREMSPTCTCLRPLPRTWRFDADSGRFQVLHSTEADWKKLKKVRIEDIIGVHVWLPIPDDGAGERA